MKRLLVFALVALPSFGYNLQTTTSGGQTFTLQRIDNTAMSFFLNDKVAVGLTNPVTTKQVFSSSSNPTAATEAALASWNAVTTANIHFNTLQTTALGPAQEDCKNVILVGTSVDDIAAVGGAIAITISSRYNVPNPVCKSTTVSPAGTIFDSDIIFSPGFTYSTDNTADTIDFQSVLTHELGHALGADHSSLVGATMFPTTGSNQLNQRILSSDDIGFVTALYPSASASVGTLSGTISTSGGAAVKFALVTAIDRTAGTTYSSLTGADGNYSVLVRAGSYIVFAEPFNDFISPVNIRLVDAGQVTTGFLPTFLGSAGSPTATAVTAGQTATANITVTSGTSSLTTPSYSTGTVGGSGDILGPFPGLGYPIALNSGQSLDMGIGTGGIDTSTTFLVFGRGISIRAGTTRADPKVSFGAGKPLMRFTLDIPAQTDTTLATLLIVKGNNVLAYSGGLVITPAKPVVSGVFDAESARPSFTSGQWVAIYGSNLGGTTRTWGGSDFTGGVSTGSPLPSVLDGVSVTINSAPASIFLVSPGQLNALTPSNLTPGPATVVVTNNGVVSATFQGTVVNSSPSFFYYPAGGKIYAAAAHLDARLVGDPAVQSGSVKAHPGETIQMYVNGIAPATGGIIVPVTAFTQQVSISAGSTALTTSAPYLVAAGQFQVNVTLPTGIAAGDYTLTMSVPGGSTSDSGLTVILPVGP